MGLFEEVPIGNLNIDSNLDAILDALSYDIK
jgi:hypothetical protein